MEILLVSLKIGNIVDLKYFGSFDGSDTPTQVFMGSMEG